MAQVALYIQRSTVIQIIWGIVAILLLFTDEARSVLSGSAADKNGNICLLLKEKGTPKNDRLGDIYKAVCLKCLQIPDLSSLQFVFFMDNSDDRHNT